MKNKFFALGSTCALGVSMLFSGCGVKEVDATVTTSVSTTPISIVADPVLDYMQSADDVLITDLQKQIGWQQSTRYDLGRPVEIAYTFSTKSDKDIKEGVIEVYEKGSSEVFTAVEFSPFEEYISVYNLKTDQAYRYVLTLTLTNEQKITSEGEFSTAKSPRFMYVDGASNVRDVGGWNSTLGGKIKQGVLYRGGEIDGKKNQGVAGFFITAGGKKTLLNVMKIKTDFDLRDPYALQIDQSKPGILGKDVTRTFLPSAYYEQILNSKSTLKTAFTAFANPEAYPAYIHCTHGVDRAGTMMLVLEALLGVEKADLIRDYELSNFFYPHVDRTYNENGGDILTLISKLESDYEGATLADKTADMLIKSGVTQQQIDAIRSIFIEN